MDFDRRSFLRAAAGTAVASYVPLTASGVAVAQTSRSGLLTMGTFSPHVNTTFRFTVAGRAISMALKQVVDERRRGTTGECFSLLFAGPKPAFGSGTYTVDHTSLSRFSLFVTPVNQRRDGQDYQAVFNRVAG